MNKLLSCRYNMDANRVEARFADGFGPFYGVRRTNL